MSHSDRHEMGCDDCLERLYAFLEEDLPDTERVAMGSHLEDCGHCLEELDAVRRRDAFLAKVRESCAGDVAPPSLKDRIDQLLPPR